MLTDCAPLSLLEYLKEHVSAISDESTRLLNLYVLIDEYENNNNDDGSIAPKNKKISPKQFGNEFMARKNLILIYQKDQLVIGLTTFEYADCVLRLWTRSYIQYVDTTGLYTPRQYQTHLTKSLLKAYLSYCADELKIERIHLLATGKPSLLFAGSELNEGKRALPSVKLVNWWINLIKDFTAERPVAKVFVYSPTEAVEGSSRLKKRISAFENSWTYGLPYDACELSRPCTDLIPLFEDDPKWRHFESIQEDNDGATKTKNKRPRISNNYVQTNVAISVKEFFESLQIRSEFRSDACAFIVIRFPITSGIRDTLNDPSMPISQAAVKTSNLASFATKLLGSLTFENESEALKSSKKVSAWLKLMGVGSISIKTTTKLEKNDSLGNSESRKENEMPLVVNSLPASLIKRK